VGDFDALNSPEFSTGYVPTTLLVEDGKVVEKFAGNNCKLVPSHPRAPRHKMTLASRYLCVLFRFLADRKILQFVG